MKLAPLALLLALASCAATPKGEYAYELATTVYEMPTELAQSLAGRADWSGQPAPESLLERARAAAESHPEVAASARPTIHVREGSTAHTSNMTRTDFVKDWNVDAQGQAEAVVGKAPDGLEIELRPCLRGSSIELEFRFKQCCLLRPIREAEVKLANGEKKKVQLTEVVTQETKSKALLAKGQCLATLLPGRTEGRTTLICVRAAVVGPRR